LEAADCREDVRRLRLELGRSTPPGSHVQILPARAATGGGAEILSADDQALTLLWEIIYARRKSGPL
jgi:hypothetical protein